jgi:hypothetical protein
MNPIRLRWLFSAALLFVASFASARIISYSPYTNRSAWPLLQSRENRYFVLFEDTAAFSGKGELVLYDSQGEHEPQVIMGPAMYYGGAVREQNDVSSILVEATFPPTGQPKWFYSSDSGTTWKTVSVPFVNLPTYNTTVIDTGGPWIRSRVSQIRTGNDATPFVVVTNGAMYAVDADGTSRTLIAATSGVTLTLAGRSRDGASFIVRRNTDLLIVDNAGHQTVAGTVPANAEIEGWITPSNDVYLDSRVDSAPVDHRITRYAATGGVKVVAQTSVAGAIALFATPTYDFTGAWIIRRANGQPTVLSRQSGTGDAVEQWSDITSPEVEALHTGASGNTLLVQVHRPRTIDPTQIFRDPALAIWRAGQPAPRFYNELFMNEQTSKAFVHLQVDKAASGDPFVFDSGAQIFAFPSPVSGGAPAPGGGSDVLQEWGVVRASLAQKLVLPGISRVDGAFGSHWQSDVVLFNPSDDVQNVVVDYIPTGSTPQAQTKTLTLAAREIRVINDALKALFNVTAGGGAFVFTPDDGINVTSRTYTTTDKGTYGFSMNGIDYYAAAASPRFPLTFSGAFPGPNFRTNLVITDTSGRGTDTSNSGAGLLGAMGIANVVFSAPANGQQQYNGISFQLGLSSNDNGALVVAPTHGTAIATVVAIDNRTNDPTYFPPDIPASTVRTIPAIGHLDGANGSKFRSDLYLYNPSPVARAVSLQIKAWDVNEFVQPVNFTLLAGEARVIPDALQKLFGRSGIARLRYQSPDGINGQGVRVTSRTYSVDENGGTYGFLMPPLNNFQMAAAGDTLEILGVVGGSGFRTNLGLVDTNANAGNQNAQAKVEIIDQTGKTIDTFTVTFPSAGGTQLNDHFHARGLGDGPAAALIRVTPIVGTIGAYATMNDNGTNDPTYLAANLGAH